MRGNWQNLILKLPNSESEVFSESDGCICFGFFFVFLISFLKGNWCANLNAVIWNAECWMSSEEVSWFSLIKTWHIFFFESLESIKSSVRKILHLKGLIYKRQLVSSKTLLWTLLKIWCWSNSESSKSLSGLLYRTPNLSYQWFLIPQD